MKIVTFFVTLAVTMSPYISNTAGAKVFPEHNNGGVHNNDRENWMLNHAQRSKFSEALNIALNTNPRYAVTNSQQFRTLAQEFDWTITEDEANQLLPRYRELLFDHIMKKYDLTGGIGVCNLNMWQM